MVICDPGYADLEQVTSNRLIRHLADCDGQGCLIQSLGREGPGIGERGLHHWGREGLVFGDRGLYHWGERA